MVSHGQKRTETVSIHARGPRQVGWPCYLTSQNVLTGTKLSQAEQLQYAGMAAFSLATMIVGAGVLSQEAVAATRAVEELGELERVGAELAHGAEAEARAAEDVGHAAEGAAREVGDTGAAGRDLSAGADAAVGAGTPSGRITETWDSKGTLSNGQTNKAFRESGTECYYCGNKLDPESPRYSERPVTGHIYPRGRALQKASSQEIYNAYVTDVRNLRVMCNSCNGIQGGFRSPNDMVIRRWATPTRQSEAQGIFDFIGQLYGFEP